MIKWMMIYMKEKYNKMGEEESWVLDTRQMHGRYVAGGPLGRCCSVKTRSHRKPISTPVEKHLEVRDKSTKVHEGQTPGSHETQRRGLWGSERMKGEDRTRRRDIETSGI